MHTTKRIIVVGVLATTLVACSSTNSKENLDYHTPGAKNPEDMLIVPPDLTGIVQNNRYTLPAGAGAVRASQLGNNAGVANGSNTVLPEIKNMHIEREGSQRWLSIGDKTPQEIWPILKVFWQENGFVIDQENPEIGFMQTQWAENRASIPSDPIRRLFQKVGLGNIYSSAYRDRFIIRLERQKSGGSFVTFSHQGVEEELLGKNKDSSKWVPRDNDPNLEAQMLSRFMMRLGADQALVEQELTRNSVTSGELAKIEGDNLILSGSHERNIYRLGLALNRIGLTVQNFNESDGSFTVQPADMESDAVSNVKPGLFPRMFGGKKETKVAKKDAFNIKVTNEGNSSIVSIPSNSGYNSKNILERLWRELR